MAKSLRIPDAPGRVLQELGGAVLSNIQNKLHQNPTITPTLNQSPCGTLIELAGILPMEFVHVPGHVNTWTKTSVPGFIHRVVHDPNGLPGRLSIRMEGEVLDHTDAAQIVSSPKER